MSKSFIPVNTDVNGPKIASHVNSSNEQFQAVVITNGDITSPQPISPATEATLGLVVSTLNNSDSTTTNIDSTLTTVDGTVDDIAVTLSNIEDNTNVMNDIETALVLVTSTAVGIELTAGMTGTRTIMLRNMDSTNTVSVGKLGVTYATGWKMLPDDPALAFDASFAWYGICDVGLTANVNVMELK